MFLITSCFISIIICQVKDNQTVVVEGETGSGKTTQIPQFLVEAGYGAVGEGWLVFNSHLLTAVPFNQFSLKLVGSSSI